VLVLLFGPEVASVDYSETAFGGRWEKWLTQTSGRRVVRSERSSATRIVAEIYSNKIEIFFCQVFGLLVLRDRVK
jgi:hypothetical protein